MHIGMITNCETSQEGFLELRTHSVGLAVVPIIFSGCTKTELLKGVLGQTAFSTGLGAFSFSSSCRLLCLSLARRRSGWAKPKQSIEAYNSESDDHGG